MRHSIVGYYNNAAGGAGTYTIPIISVNGQVKAQNAFTAPKNTTIVRMSFISTVGTHAIITRSSHPENLIHVPALADSGADYEQEMDLEAMLGKGVAILGSEEITLQGLVTGNGTMWVFLELDDSVPAVDMRCVRAAGANAAVATAPVETGGNVCATLAPTKKYTMEAIYFHSTTPLGLAIGMRAGELSQVKVHTALLIGHKFTVINDRQKAALSGLGSEWKANFQAYLQCSAADAAAVQFFYPLLSVG